MARQKKTSADLEMGNQRLTGLLSIEANLDLGDGLSVANLQEKLSDLDSTVKSYNTALSNVDTMGNQIKSKEKVVRDLAVRFLNAVAGKYGKDSDEYEKAGGTRKSERKKPARKPKQTSTPA